MFSTLLCVTETRDGRAGGKMRMCGSADIVMGNLRGNLRIQNCGSKTADTTLIESFA